MAATSENFNDVLEFVAPTGGVTIGVMALVSGTWVLPLATASATVAFAGKCAGRVNNVVAATSQAWVAGQIIYVTSGGTFTTSSTGNTKIGYAASIKASAAAVGDVILLQR